MDVGQPPRLVGVVTDLDGTLLRSDAGNPKDHRARAIGGCCMREWGDHLGRYD